MFLLTGCIPGDWREPILASSCDGLAFYQQALLDILRTVEKVNCRNRWSRSTTPTPEPRPAWALRQSGLEPAQRLGLYGFGASLPSAPGFVGTLHAATMGGLLLYGLPRALALSAALVYHATVFATLVLAGLGCLLAESILAGRRIRLVDFARAEALPGLEAKPPLVVD